MVPTNEFSSAINFLKPLSSPRMKIMEIFVIKVVTIKAIKENKNSRKFQRSNLKYQKSNLIIHY